MSYLARPALAEQNSSPDESETATQEASAETSDSNYSLFLLSNAREHYAAGRFEDAMVLLERAYNATNGPRFLFNLGAVHHAMGHCSLARNYYEGFLLVAENGKKRDEAKLALGNLYEHCGHSQLHSPRPQQEGAAGPNSVGPLLSPGLSPEVTSELAPDLSPELPTQILAQPSRLLLSRRNGLDSNWQGDSWRRTTSISLIGTGAALGLAGTITYFLMHNAHDDLQAQRRRVSASGGIWNDAEDAEEAGRLTFRAEYRSLTWALGVGSGLAFAAGATLLALELNTNSSLLGTSAGLPGISYCQQF